MIFTNLNAVRRPRSYPPILEEVFAYLQSNDFTSTPVGVYPLRGDQLLVQVIETKTQPIEQRRAEAHRQFIDVQYLVRGKERLGIAADLGRYPVAEYIEERDLCWYDVPLERESFLESEPGCVCVFFPGELHRPAIAVDAPAPIKKVVVKIDINLL